MSDKIDLHIVIDPKVVIAKMAEKKTQLCIGLDIRLPQEDRLNKALEIIENTGDLAIAYKPNRQFWLGFSLSDMQILTSAIKKQDAFAIIDHKLSDIGSTNDAALKWSKSEGFDLITISPFPGNIDTCGKSAKEINIGLIYLFMMSNPESSWMVNAPLDQWAREMEANATGIVVGLSDYLPLERLKELAELIPSPFILAPGLGAQGGKIDIVKSIFGNRVMYSVSRGISQATNHREAAENYYNVIHR